MTLYPAVVIAVTFVVVAIADFVAFDYLRERESVGNPRNGKPSWITTDEGRLACMPAGAIVVVLKRLWAARNK